MLVIRARSLTELLECSFQATLCMNSAVGSCASHAYGLPFYVRVYPWGMHLHPRCPERVGDGPSLFFLCAETEPQ